MKVLIISHNPITTYQSMGKTFLSLFSSFSKNQLCQLYIYPAIPDIDICNSYYQVTDRSIIKSYFKFRKVESKVIDSNDINQEKHDFYETKSDEKLMTKKKNSLKLLIRDFLWRWGAWYNSDMESWLKKEKPTCIFLAPGESKFIYNIALKISKKLNIKIMMYICDDYYFVSDKINKIDRLQLTLLKRKIKETIEKSDYIITICDDLQEIYYNKFGVNTKTIYTGSNFKISESIKDIKEIHGITYMGNISNKRYESIADLGKVLDKINLEQGTEYKLFLYINKIKDSEKKCFENIKSIVYCGYVVGADFKKVMYNSDALLHVESFDEKCIDIVKNSISTKIADSLGSGIPLVAYAPKGIASMKYLEKLDVAFTITSYCLLQEKIKEVFIPDLRNTKVSNALKIARKNHDSYKNSVKLYKIIDKMTK